MIIILGCIPKDTMDYLNRYSYQVVACVTTKQEFEKMHTLTDCLLVDISSREKLLKKLAANISTPPTAIITFYERYIIARSWAGEFYHIPSISESSAHTATDKALMRAAFTSYDPTITPQFAIMTTERDVAHFAHKYGFPFMIKPTNLQKSLLVTKIHESANMLQKYSFIKKTITKIYAKEHRTQNPCVIAEEFLDGTMHSVQTFADKNGNVMAFGEPIDLLTAKDRGIDDTHIFARISPSNLSPRQKNKLNITAIIATKALHLTNTPGHVELILTKSGPKVIEVGPRIGGYRTRLYHMSQNLNLNDALIQNASGIQIIQKNNRSVHTAIIELFPKEDGLFSAITNIDHVQKLQSYDYHSVKRVQNEPIGLAKNGYRTACVIILKITKKKQFMQDFDFIKNHVHVLTK